MLLIVFPYICGRRR